MRDFDLPPFAETAAIPTFTPVPLTRHRRDGWTPERQRSFITTLASTGQVAVAARAAGLSVTSAYKLRGRTGADSFATAWDGALADARARALTLAMDAAFTGTLTPRRYRGNFTGTLIRRDDMRALLAALRAVTAVPPSG